jgi:hypothetical protein
VASSATCRHSIRMRPTPFIRSMDDAAAPGLYLTNYESIRDGKLDPRLRRRQLDEASILRGFGGTKTFREFMRLFEGTPKYRFVATATPSPTNISSCWPMPPSST